MSEESQKLFEEVISQNDAAVQEIARATRALIYDVLPQVVEVVWTQQRNIGYGTGPKKMSEHFSWIGLTKSYVQLGFFYGTELPDPDGLLEGTGKMLRHIKLRSVADVQRPAVRAMLDFAKTHRVPPPKTS